MCKIMAKRHYDEAEVIRSLKLKNCSFQRTGMSNVIVIPRNSSTIGIRSWGKIDYLVNHCGYIRQFTNAKIKEEKEKENVYDSIIKNAKKEVKTIKIKK